MKILCLTLYRYNRFSVKGIEFFNYEPDTVIQLILGPNGSGKSSLLKELSPLPAELKVEYGDGGYKKIKIEHHGSIYELLSEKSSTGNVFSFIKDGNELNPGHTVSIFRDLVRTEFNYTQEIHDLMTGKLRFSGMDTSTRRSIFTRLPSTDYTYAIRYYKKLSEGYRDTTGAIKHISGRLVQERDRSVSESEYSTLKEDLVHLKDYLSYVLESKTIAPYSVEEAESHIARANSSIISTYKRMASLISQFRNDGNARSISDLSEEIEHIEKSLVINNTKRGLIFEEASKLERSIDELERNQADSLESFKERISERKKYIAEVTENIHLGLKFDDPVTALEVINSEAGYVIELLTSLSPDPSRSMGQSRYEALKLEKSSIEISISEIQDTLDSLNLTKKDLLHKKDHADTQCPSCNFRFNVNFSQALLTEVDETITSKTEVLTSLKEKHKDVISDIDKIVDRFDKLRAFSQLAKNYKAVDPFWNYLRQEVLFNNPGSIVNAINTVRMDLINLSEIQRLTQDDARESETIALMVSFRNSSLDDLKKDFESKSSEMLNLQNERVELESKLAGRINAKNIASELLLLKVELETYTEDRNSRMRSIADIIRNELRGKLIQAIQLEITSRENRISGITSHKRVISDLEQQLETLTKKKEVLNAAMKVLSPSEGLIAKGITGFINHFVSKMNAFISKIWSYKFEIKPIIPDDNLDLDYKFAISIGDSGESPDISKTSRGQQEIIDLAFTAIAAKYLKVENFPLYLDEFGSSFDKDHRDAVSTMMHSLSTTSSFSQVFIISHYEEMYGSFKNTDITMFHDPSLESMTDSAFNKVTTFR